MKSSYLSNKFKTPGWILLIMGSFFGILYLFFDYTFGVFDVEKYFALVNVPFINGENGRLFVLVNEHQNLQDEFAAFIIIIGGLFLLLSREKDEDEFILQLKSDALTFSILVNYIILIPCIFLFYDFAFLNVLILNMFTSLFIYIIKFHWSLYRAKKSLENA
ncbi:hypothetical protein [Flammeovirga agarivorans]|uniref:Uncharacterized protein n=1 Tax=Flammeovirga agarivorans TaxID=2726742 RepID=A0A7X8SGH0_9BACT|nr:hypothetical protein [Flammeovirga agarivorans]NLR89652.1 hypothetical protein [Flammeovirga agarivorans]